MWKWRQKVKEEGEIDRKDPKDRTELIEIEANEASHQGRLRMGKEFYLDQDYNFKITYLHILLILFQVHFIDYSSIKVTNYWSWLSGYHNFELLNIHNLIFYPDFFFEYFCLNVSQTE